MKRFIGILKSSVTVENRMSVRIQSDSFIKCGKYNIIVIAVPDLESYDTSVIKIKNCTQIQLLDDRSDIIFELRYISQPFLIRLVCVEISVQNILRCDLRCRWDLCILLDTSDRFQMQYLHQSVYPFLIVMHVMLTVDHNCHLAIS